jgi:hypothetical protein
MEGLTSSLQLNIWHLKINGLGEVVFLIGALHCIADLKTIIIVVIL